MFLKGNFMIEHRRPFAFVSNNCPEEGQQYRIEHSSYGKITGSYIFNSSDSNLLIDIDNNNADGVAHALERQKIDVNTLYVIPSWEIPEADRPMLQTFLHRALWEKSEDVFKFLLDKGANPRIAGHCHDTVIDNLFGCKEEDFLKFGKMLVDAGMTVSEIQKRAKYRNDKSGVLKLIKYATNATFDSRNSRIACKSSSDNRKKIPFTVSRQR